LSYLDQVARLIRKYPNSRVYIEGHAFDEGSEHEAVKISQNRSDEVLRYLVEKGKVSPDNLYSRGHGDSSPLDMSDTEEARTKNRRVDIILMTK
jgi:outer membrane protein OmpA-like peptidoglycan-associated protein